ncbi:MAG: bifunctional nicotinamidase/pyrazinamidase [Coriobacteriia bacterium]|nr:bifunctional nicotinamidase/pyrazinamidase [Coriobacteriia bacterium]
MRALLLIDVQNDFMPFGSLPVVDGDAVVAVANALAPRFDLVVATQDWHPIGHASFASSHPGHSAGEVIDVEGLPQVLWADHCVQNTPGASFHSGLDVAQVDHVARKGTDPRIDSYSGFFDNNHAKDTGLSAYLRARGVDEIWVAGLALDYCVKFTALDGRREGFDVVLVEDGCRAVNLSPDDGAKALTEMAQAGCTIVTSGDV